MPVTKVGGRRRVAVFGGSFNPPHIGHVLVATWVRSTGAADEVWWVPTWVHPFGKQLAPFDVRVAMCDAVAQDLGPWARVDTIEATLPEPSFSITMLNALASAHPDVSFRLIVGADTLTETNKWRGWDEISERYTPILAGRSGHADIGALQFPNISSTEIRQRLAKGESVSHLLPVALVPMAEAVWGTVNRQR